MMLEGAGAHAGDERSRHRLEPRGITAANLGLDACVVCAVDLEEGADEEGGGLPKGVQLAFDGFREHADSLSHQQVDRGTEHEAAVVGGHRMGDECVEHCISQVCGAQPGDISILLQRFHADLYPIDQDSRWLGIT